MKTLAILPLFAAAALGLSACGPKAETTDANAALNDTDAGLADNLTATDEPLAADNATLGNDLLGNDTLGNEAATGNGL
ncbi:hypothetical protein [Sphingomonas abaci]|uniref:Circumsporozoite protein n=1 Tax=Sphingomonas abaci TaxID=237611 RepID=A0A7W7AL29_9SPHN|nr:hypothetical protein [Sphingomonas abaci]MBB4619027.1 hypothetical protein [Sphingomonas abaci]